ncbi:MAG: S8 family serine peptidase [Chloroflexi bacterium]|nr:S8 family serine peptidase [Chloroflexota bacterium]
MKGVIGGVAGVIVALAGSGWLLANPPQTARALASVPTPTPPAPLYFPLILEGVPSAEILPVGSYLPNDPLFASQWAMAKVDASDAWAFTRGSSSVIVAILDSGVYIEHPDLTGKLRMDIADNYLNPGSPPADDNGHGTHVSGIAGAVLDNKIGIAGMGGADSLLPIKILNSSGQGYFSNLADAIYYAADHGARVINMSLGSQASANFRCATTFPYLQTAIDYAYNKGVLLVAAAGNEGSPGEVVPADCTHVLGVASTDGNDTASYFSNYGNYVAVAAPGGTFGEHHILSTCWPETDGGVPLYCEMYGTSMAAPMVSGLAALVLARNPSYTPDQVASAILDNATDLGTEGWDPNFGCGRINAGAALMYGALGSVPVCLPGTTTYFTNAQAAASGTSSLTLANSSFAPGRLILRFKPGVTASSANAALAAINARLERVERGGYWRVNVTPGREAALLKRLAADPRLAFAGVDYMMSAK